MMVRAPEPSEVSRSVAVAAPRLLLAHLPAAPPSAILAQTEGTVGLYDASLAVAREVLNGTKLTQHEQVHLWGVIELAERQLRSLEKIAASSALGPIAKHDMSEPVAKWQALWRDDTYTKPIYHSDFYDYDPLTTIMPISGVPLLRLGQTQDNDGFISVLEAVRPLYANTN